MIWDAPDVGLEWYDGMCEESGGGGWHFIWDFCLGGWPCPRDLVRGSLEFNNIPALLP